MYNQALVILNKKRAKPSHLHDAIEEEKEESHSKETNFAIYKMLNFLIIGLCTRKLNIFSYSTLNAAAEMQTSHNRPL